MSHIPRDGGSVTVDHIMSAETPIQTHLIEANAAYASNFTHGDLALPPAKKYLVLTCMDARIDPAAALGISPGDAHVIRNAGASAHEALRSIVISQQLLGTREVILIKHTDCGMLTFTNEVARGLVAENLGAEAAAEVEGLDFLTFPELEEEVRSDVEWLRGRKAVAEVPVSGWVYDVRADPKSSRRLGHLYLQVFNLYLHPTLYLDLSPARMIMVASKEPPQAQPSFEFTPESLLAEAEFIIDRTKALEDHLAATLTPETATFKNLLVPLTDDDLAARSRTSLLHFIGTVHADQALRDASLEADKLLNAAWTESIARRDIAALVKAVYERHTRGEETLDAEDSHLLEQTWGGYRRNGSALEEGPERDRFLELKRELQEILNAARKTLNEADDGVWFTREELEGVPDRNIAKYRRHEDGSETYRVTFRGGDYPALMQNAVNSATRKKAYLARYNRFPENVDRLKKIVKLRDILAKILKYENHASLKMESRMSESVETVVDFLQDLRTRLTPIGKEDIQAVLELKRSHLQGRGITDEEELSTLYEWDWAFYVRMYDREKFALDMTKFPEYFEVWHTLKGMFSIFERLFGLVFRSAECNAWHEDVILYTVWDSEERGGDFLGYLYLDIFNRKGKLSQARHTSIVPGYINQGRGKRQYRVSTLVLSLSKPTPDTPTLLIHGEVKTMFHELGHAIHYLVSKTKYALGFSRDFVEIPSIMLENWIWEPDVLIEVSRHYSLLGEDHRKHWEAEKTKAIIQGKPAEEPQPTLPRTFATDLARTRAVNGTQHILSLIHQALFDLTIHTGTGYNDVSEIDPTRLYNELGNEIRMLAGCLDKRTGEPNTIGQASFGHIFRAYDAGYFAYAMARTIAMDLYTSFFANDPMNSQIGANYRQNFLELGARRPESEILQNFLGRKPSTIPFFEFLANAPKPGSESETEAKLQSRLA
ncbi:hypothetical protein jhhlp_000307 [Lomentospora prolificans]|uniref:Peptidase M3A/M3B catalytic domain-containing protein n=1 Tax=Lomentospora prolificans TaxID=41688 RepID=A0A2N3NKG8_9PEZI|nr:hypothetical protein jhhlp_000307 [Lomentospora prolificans]